MGKYADTRVLGTERMVFSSIKRSEAIIDKASTEENNQSQDQVRDGDGAKGREDIREGVGINIDRWVSTPLPISCIIVIFNGPPSYEYR